MKILIDEEINLIISKYYFILLRSRVERVLSLFIKLRTIILFNRKNKMKQLIKKYIVIKFVKAKY